MDDEVGFITSLPAVIIASIHTTHEKKKKQNCSIIQEPSF